MIERRNFYRILHVQPDASMVVIKESYQALIKKLKAHPELASSNWNESLLALAFDTLGDPLKRAEYDRELLNRYHIKELSQGALGANVNPGTNRRQSSHNGNFTQRNYYRILQIQPDAPITAIKASYQALKKNFPLNAGLLDEAYRILSDPEMRQQYDAFLIGKILHTADTAAEKKPAASSSAIMPQHTPGQAIQPYTAVIRHYCSFCKTPYVPQISPYQTGHCLECASPLHLLQHENPEMARRTMMRINITGMFDFYLYWPDKPFKGVFQDLSPTGIRFLSTMALDTKDIIKIDAPNFQAVAEVTHRQHANGSISVGTRFIAVKFEQLYGNFVSLEA